MGLDNAAQHPGYLLLTHCTNGIKEQVIVQEQPSTTLMAQSAHQFTLS